ncbi:basic salivary proline-rich protein 2-like [Homarus americanus]|uniref:basic salivary proline-rich protein 2-like n=1 Tax=Homarus americanus TaxID=6706 RepID=UPI001C44BA60|nr:basic salivary proline-rich protein 2-like [Homarus americanus]
MGQNWVQQGRRRPQGPSQGWRNHQGPSKGRRRPHRKSQRRRGHQDLPGAAVTPGNLPGAAVPQDLPSCKMGRRRPQGPSQGWRNHQGPSKGRRRPHRKSQRRRGPQDGQGGVTPRNLPGRRYTPGPQGRRCPQAFQGPSGTPMGRRLPVTFPGAAASPGSLPVAAAKGVGALSDPSWGGGTSKDPPRNRHQEPPQGPSETLPETAAPPGAPRATESPVDLLTVPVTAPPKSPLRGSDYPKGGDAPRNSPSDGAAPRDPPRGGGTPRDPSGGSSAQKTLP